MVLTALPQNGIEATMIEPPSIDHLYPDPDETLSVHLAVVPACSGGPTDNHWMLMWTVSDGDHDPIVRRLQIVREIGFDHLTNWGPLTVTSDELTNPSKKYSVGELTLSQRKDLERIALDTPVMMPNGEWNCQNWTTDVIKEAMKQKLLESRIVDGVLISARGIQPLSTPGS